MHTTLANLDQNNFINFQCMFLYDLRANSREYDKPANDNRPLLLFCEESERKNFLCSCIALTVMPVALNTIERFLEALKIISTN